MGEENAIQTYSLSPPPTLEETEEAFRRVGREAQMLTQNFSSLFASLENFRLVSRLADYRLIVNELSLAVAIMGREKVGELVSHFTKILMDSSKISERDVCDAKEAFDSACLYLIVWRYYDNRRVKHQILYAKKMRTRKKNLARMRLECVDLIVWLIHESQMQKIRDELYN